VRYGFVDEAHQIMRGMLDVATRNHWRLPELISGLSRDELSVPAAYPTSCEPQAWAAATPLLFLRLLLRLDPWVPRGKVNVSPALPSWLTRLRVDGIPIGDARLSVEIDADGVLVEGVVAGVTVEATARHPFTSLFDPA
jgi:glycogen debranching enzyme